MTTSSGTRGLLIGGSWVEGAGGGYEVRNPATEAVVGVAPEASAEDARAAAAAAAEAFPAWSRTAPEERAALLDKVGDLLEARMADLVPLVQAETGATLAVTNSLQIPQAITRFRRYAKGALEPTRIPLPPGQQAATPLAPGGLISAVAVRQPVGVVAAITSYNFPLTNMAGKICPALAMGNTVVVKPSEFTPLSTLRLLELVEASGALPHGLLQAVVGDGEVGEALVSHPGLIPLVIIRGSGPTTRELSAHGAAHGVRTLAHADGGGVLYLDAHADTETARTLVRTSLDRLGVCNRLNLLLVHESRWDDLLPAALQELDALGVHGVLPPHDRERGFEWALDEGNEANVTIDRVASAQEAATIANDETSGLAAGICTTDADTANRFLDAYAGTGAFWNATTRLLDGFKLLAAPETGINVDHVPGPRGPVTFRDLALRQFVVRPA